VIEKNDEIPVHEKKRASLQGKVSRVSGENELKRLKNKYLEIFPRSQVFFTLADFHFYSLEPREIYWVGGFGKIASFSPPLAEAS
jgi:hypothetical protein